MEQGKTVRPISNETNIPIRTIHTYEKLEQRIIIQRRQEVNQRDDTNTIGKLQCNEETWEKDTEW